MVIYLVYLATNKINGKRYIGQTRRSLGLRMSGHIAVSKDPIRRSRSVLAQAIHKYGIESFEWVVLRECSTQKEVDAAEREFIDTYGTLSPDGYNLRTGGGPGWIPSEETRKKMSAAKIGVKRSAAARKRQGDATRGKPKTPEHRAAISAGLKGRPLAWAHKIAEARRLNGTRPSEKQLASLARGREMSKLLRESGAIHNRGDKCGNAKLTWEQVRQIRSLYATGSYHQKELGALFGVDQSAIGSITRNRTWKEDCAPSVPRIHSRLSKEQRMILVSGKNE